MRRAMVTTMVVAVLVGGAALPSGAGTRATVKMRDNATANFYAPRTLRIEQGTRVRWVNRGSNPHTTTSNSGVWDSNTLTPGESFSKRFRKSGTFRFHCEIHSGMTGKIVVG